MSAFRRCVEGDATLQIANDIAEGKRLEVSSTPTFFVARTARNGELVLVKRIKGLLLEPALQKLLTEPSTTEADGTNPFVLSGGI